MFTSDSDPHEIFFDRSGKLPARPGSNRASAKPKQGGNNVTGMEFYNNVMNMEEYYETQQFQNENSKPISAGQKRPLSSSKLGGNNPNMRPKSSGGPNNFSKKPAVKPPLINNFQANVTLQNKPSEATEFARLRPKNIQSDKEQLYEEILQTKSLINSTKEENMRLKARIQTLEKENFKYEKILEEVETTGVLQAKRTMDKNFISFSLKKQMKEMKAEINFKDEEIKKLKKNIKLTKIQELEVERKTLSLETKRLRQMLEDVLQNKGFANSDQNAASLEEKYYYQNNLIVNLKRDNEEMANVIKDLEAEGTVIKHNLGEAEKKNKRLQADLKILQRDREQDSNKMKEMTQLMNQRQLIQQQMAGSLAKGKDVVRPSSAHVDGSPNIDKKELLAKLREKDRLVDEMERKMKDVNSRADTMLKMEANERSKMLTQLEKANEEIQNLKDQLKGGSKSGPEESKKSKNEDEWNRSKQGSKQQANVKIVNKVQIEDIVHLGEEINLRLRAKGIPYEKISNYLFEQDSYVTSILQLKEVLKIFPFYINNEMEAELLSRYLVENDEEQTVKLSLEKNCENDIILMVFTQLVGKYQLMTPENEASLELELCDLVGENKAKLKNALTSLSKKGLLTKSALKSACKMIELVALKENHLDYSIIALLRDLEDYKEININKQENIVKNKEEEEERKARDIQRKFDEAEEEKRRNQRMIEDQRKMEEEKRLEELKEEELKKADELRKLEEKRRLEEEKRLENQRREEEQKRIAEEKILEAKRRKEKEDEENRIREEKQREEEFRKAEEKRIKEEQERLEEERRLEEEKENERQKNLRKQQKRRKQQELDALKKEEEEAEQERERLRVLEEKKRKEQKEEEERIRKEKEEEERFKREEEERKRRREEEERLKREEEERKRRREEEERLKREEEERKRRSEEEERLRREQEEERQRKLEQERQRKEEEERKLAEEKQRIEEQERRRKEEEDRLKREEEEKLRRMEEESLRKAEEERKRKTEEEERLRRLEEERLRKVEDERKRQEEEQRRLKEEEERLRKEKEEKSKEEEIFEEDDGDYEFDNTNEGLKNTQSKQDEDERTAPVQKKREKAESATEINEPKNQRYDEIDERIEDKERVVVNLGRASQDIKLVKKDDQYEEDFGSFQASKEDGKEKVNEEIEDDYQMNYEESIGEEIKEKDDPKKKEVKENTQDKSSLPPIKGSLPPLKESSLPPLKESSRGSKKDIEDLLEKKQKEKFNHLYNGTEIIEENSRFEETDDKLFDESKKNDLKRKKKEERKSQLEGKSSPVIDQEKIDDKAKRSSMITPKASEDQGEIPEENFNINEKKLRDSKIEEIEASYGNDFNEDEKSFSIGEEMENPDISDGDMNL